MITKFKLVVASSVVSLCSLSFASEIYCYTNKNGTTVCSNKGKAPADAINVHKFKGGGTVYVSPTPLTKPQTQATSGYKAKIVDRGLNSVNNRGTNETGRKQILRDELGQEKQALSDSQKALIDGKAKLASEKNNPQKYNERMQSLQDAITEHQKNIATLSKQLGE